MRISAVTMYLNGERFSGGRTVILTLLCVPLPVILITGALYGFWTARQLKRLTASIHDISLRCYLPRSPPRHIRGFIRRLKRTGFRDQSQRPPEGRDGENARRMDYQYHSRSEDSPSPPIKGYAEIIRMETPGRRTITDATPPSC